MDPRPAESTAEPAGAAARRAVASAAVLAVAGVLFLAMRLPLLAVPFERDEGEYAYIAQRMLVGELPYRDAFDQKPPGVFLAYAAVFALFGQSVEAVHGFAAVWLAATAWLLFALVRHLLDGLAASFAVLIFVLSSADTHLGANAANTELFMLLPMVASVACAVRACEVSSAVRWWFAAGALAAAACWFKQTAATNALFVAAIPLLPALRGGPPGGQRSLGGAYAGLLGGVLAVVAPVCLFFAVAGAWKPFFDSVVVHNLAYARGNDWQQGLAALRFWLPLQAPGLGVFWALAAAALLLRRRLGRRSWALLVGWLLVSLAGASVGFYFRPHYFLQTLPALSALGGATLAAAARALLERAHPAWAAVGIAALVALAAWPPWHRAAPIRSAATAAERSRAIYGDNPFPEALEIGEYIHRLGDPDDRVYVVGSEPELLFHAHRASATRYIFFYPLTGDYPDALARQQEVIAEVEAARPDWLVWFNVPTSLLDDEHTERLVFQHASAMLASGFQLEGVGLPSRTQRGFPLHWGPAGREKLRRFLRETRGAPWIAVYRRRS